MTDISVKRKPYFQSAKTLIPRKINIPWFILQRCFIKGWTCRESFSKSEKTMGQDAKQKIEYKSKKQINER